MGSAALDMAYVACGRLDAYIEQGDQPVGHRRRPILVETAGGKVEMQTAQRHDRTNISIIASNGVIDLNL